MNNEEIYRRGFLASKALWNHECERCIKWATGMNVNKCIEAQLWFEDVASALKLEDERENNS